MKKFISCLFAIVSFIIAVSLCSCNRSSADYTCAIPADTRTLVSINLQDLAQKADLGSLKEEPTLKEMFETAKYKLDANEQLVLEELWKNPGGQGIDFSVPVYLFSKDGYAAMVARVNDEDKLKGLLEQLSKGTSFPISVQDGDGCTLVYLDGGLMAFNATTLLIVSGQDMGNVGLANQMADRLLTQTKENSLVSQPVFQKFQEQPGDIRFMNSVAALAGMYASEIGYGMGQPIDMDELLLLGGLSFEPGVVSIHGETYTDNAGLKALLSQQLESSLPMQGRFLKYFPKSSLAMLSCGIDGEKWFDLLQENQEFTRLLTPENREQLKGLAKMLKGDMTAGITGLTPTGLPMFVAYAEVTDASALDELCRQYVPTQANENLTILAPFTYLYRNGNFYAYFGVRDGYFYATNDETTYRNLGQSLDESVEDAEYADLLKEHNGAIIINAEEVFNLPLIKVTTGYLTGETKLYVSLAQQIACLQMVGDGQAGVLSIRLKQKDVNALQQMVNFARTFVGL